MGVWSGATDDYDVNFDYPAETTGASGYAAVWRDKWNGFYLGPAGFWSTDARAPLAPAESKSWDSIYLWADPTYAGGANMHFAIEADAVQTPPPDRDYTLELLQIPNGVFGAPPIGTRWKVPLDRILVLTLPTYRSDDGRSGYRFSFTMGAAPEPGAAMAALLLMLLGSTKFRSRR